jgi:hypothetical protein
MNYNYESCKIVGVLSSKVDPAVALNVLSHLSVALGINLGAVIRGREWLQDATGVLHLGISKFPIIITKAKQGKLRGAIAEAKANPRIVVADFPLEMLETGHDDELAAALAGKPENQIEYLGAMIYGPGVEVDKITGRFSLWRLSDGNGEAPARSPAEGGSFLGP